MSTSLLNTNFWLMSFLLFAASIVAITRLDSSAQAQEVSVSQFIERYVPAEAKLRYRYRNLTIVARVVDLRPDSPKLVKELTFKSSGTLCLVDYQFVGKSRTIFCRGESSFQLGEVDGAMTKGRDRTDEEIEQFIFEIASDASAPWALLPGQSIIELARKRWLEIDSVDVRRTADGNELLTVSWSQKRKEDEPKDVQGTVTYDPSQDWQIVASSRKMLSVAARTESTYLYSKIPNSEALWIQSGTHKSTVVDKTEAHWRTEITEIIPTAPDKSTFEITAFGLEPTPNSSSEPESIDGDIER